MYVARVELQRFRGYASQVICPGRHAVVVGEPRAGRSDLITALRRALDPRSWSRAPDIADLHRASDDEAGAPLPETLVEVTLLGLGPYLEQELDDRLELIDLATGVPATGDDTADGQLGVRVRYRVFFDEVLGDYDHAWEYPASGNPIPRVERELLAAVVINRGAPLQLRTGGVLRNLAADHDANEVTAAIGRLSVDVASATNKLAEVNAVRDVLGRVLGTGAAQLLEMSSPAPEASIGFLADDGSIETLLRRLQPTLALDGAGPLPLSAHGSTATGILAVAEAIAAARIPESVVLADDFGDDLDAASAEYLAASLRRSSGQTWLSTRRPEVVRAFEQTEVLRLTRSHGERQHHQLAATTDRQARLARRQLHLLLIPAMTTQSVAVLEGPHDLEGYTAVADRRLQERGTLPPAAYGVRMIAAGITDGGKTQLAKLARLARELGFHVRVVVDNDKPGSDSDLIAELTSICDLVVRLPERTSVERALLCGVPAEDQLAAFTVLNAVHGLGVDVGALADAKLEECLVKRLKDKGGLHQPFVEALPDGVFPPLAAAVLDAISQPLSSTVLVQLSAP